MITPGQPRLAQKDDLLLVGDITQADLAAAQFPKTISFGNKGKTVIRLTEWS